VPFWVALFVEGTRFTHAKLLAAQEFAISRGMPVPKNVLIPRTKVTTHRQLGSVWLEENENLFVALQKNLKYLKTKKSLFMTVVFATSSLYIVENSDMINYYLNIH
jgi:hypothetical protein